ncbi:hypothetical protein [Buttiauxella gaviniae]|uniref:hypothetical protein n=1 Tax=Buttiauxella gaviniae TaxID=82990 RepID=UPI0039B0E2FD
MNNINNTVEIPEALRGLNPYQLLLESLTVTEAGEMLYSEEILSEASRVNGFINEDEYSSINGLYRNEESIDEYRNEADESYYAMSNFERVIEKEKETLNPLSIEENNQIIANNKQFISLPDELEKNPVTRSMMETFIDKYNFFKPLSARNGLTRNQALDKICNDFSFLETEEFKSIFDNYYKNGKKVTISLNTGSKIEIHKNKIFKTENTEDATNQPNIPLETKTMIALCVERNMQDIKMKGDYNHLKEAFTQAYELNKVLPEDKKVTIYPIDKEQRLLFEKFAMELNPEQFKEKGEDFVIESVPTPKKKLKM